VRVRESLVHFEIPFHFGMDYYRLDTLIRKGSAELARDLMMLERQVEDSAHNIRVLEETLLSQRELNIRNMK